MTAWGGPAGWDAAAPGSPSACGSAPSLTTNQPRTVVPQPFFSVMETRILADLTVSRCASRREVLDEDVRGLPTELHRVVLAAVLRVDLRHRGGVEAGHLRPDRGDYLGVVRADDRLRVLTALDRLRDDPRFLERR